MTSVTVCVSVILKALDHEGMLSMISLWDYLTPANACPPTFSSDQDFQASRQFLGVLEILLNFCSLTLSLPRSES